MVHVNDEGWLSFVEQDLKNIGYCIVEGVFSPTQCEYFKNGIDEALRKIHLELGLERIQKTNEIGVARLPMKFHPGFLDLLANLEIQQIVDRILGDTSILHLQCGFALASAAKTKLSGASYQQTFHMDFPRYLESYLASLNILVAVSPFHAENGATLVVPGSHQKAVKPPEDYLRRRTVPATCPAGSIVLFDSTLWHAAGQNLTSETRYAINHQFTRSFIKPQMDYVRGLDEATMLRQPAKVQQYLGYYTRVVTSLDEYYQPEEKRLYRKGQG